MGCDTVGQDTFSSGEGESNSFLGKCHLIMLAFSIRVMLTFQGNRISGSPSPFGRFNSIRCTDSKPLFQLERGDTQIIIEIIILHKTFSLFPRLGRMTDLSADGGIGPSLEARLPPCCFESWTSSEHVGSPLDHCSKGPFYPPISLDVLSPIKLSQNYFK